MAVSADTKERLTEAIKAADAEIDGIRNDDEVLVGYTVVAVWRHFGDENADQLTHIHGPDELADWQAIGMLRVAADYLQHVHNQGED